MKATGIPCTFGSFREEDRGPDQTLQEVEKPAHKIVTKNHFLTEHDFLAENSFVALDNHSNFILSS